jgi:hypothetical protein
MLPDLYQEWLNGLANGDPDQMTPMPGPQQLLEQLGAENPKLAMLMRLMANRRQAEVQEEAEVEDAIDTEMEDALESSRGDEPQANDRVHHEIDSLLHRLYAELDELRTRNDNLAAALGACYLCWGENVNCPECHGHGRPGSTQPDRDSFVEWVVPVLRRLRSGATRRKERNLPSNVQNTKTNLEPSAGNSFPG